MYPLKSGPSTAFWIFFIIMGAMIALTIPLIEVVAGILVILLGIAKIGNEIEQKKIERERVQVEETLREIRDWIQKDYEFIRSLEGKYENRFFNVNKKRTETNRKIERIVKDTDRNIDKGYRDIVRKILELDNKMTDMSRAFLKKHPRSGREKKRI